MSCAARGRLPATAGIVNPRRRLRCLDESRKALYRKQERLARGIIRKALVEPAFRAIFASDAALMAALPLRP